MPILPYNSPSSFSPVYEDARSFAIWGCSWFFDADIAMCGGPTTRAIVGSIPQTVSGGQRRSDYASLLTSLPLAVLSRINEIKNWPKGRRVVMPQYWFDDTIGGNDLANYNYYKNTTQQMLANGSVGTYINSPFQRATQSVHAKTTWNLWLDAVQSNNAEFDYLVDDQEQWRSWTLGSPQVGTGGSIPEWMSPKDARIPASIINDARFENPYYGDPITNQSMRELLVYYLNLERPSSPIANTKSAVESAYADWMGITDPSAAITPYTTARNPLGYAWTKMMWRINLRQRVEHVLSDIFTKPWFTGFYSDYNVLGEDPWDHPWLSRSYHPETSVLAHPKIRGAPELYGYASGAETTWGYHPTPTTDKQRYGFTKLSEGGTRADALAGDAGRVMYSFLGDLTYAVEASRANYRRDWSAWLGTPEWDYAVSYYQHDNRYAYELYYHVALLGCNPFIIFPDPSLANSYEAPSALLTEIKVVTENGGLRPCNADGDQYKKPERYLIKDCVTDKGIITGGTIQHGPKRGQNIWRITVPPHIVDGSGNSVVNFSDGTKYTVSSAVRGFWYTSQTKPNITITTS